MSENNKKYIGITIGDPAGIGPEVVVKAFASGRVSKAVVPLLIGPREIWKVYRRTLRFKACVVDVDTRTSYRVPLGRPSALAGKIAYASLLAGIKLARAGYIDCLVTAPVSKESFALAGCACRGHTEILRSRCGVKEAAMLMACEKIYALLATRHIPLGSVARRLKAKDIVSQTRLAAEFLREKVLRRDPKIALAGINPHSGEDGLIGKEENTIIRPARKALAAAGFRAYGPIGGDVVFLKAREGEYDLVVSPYHDQAMIALKLINARKIVNVTLGLPFLRTSPGHGTAFDIAGRNRADPSAMIEAIRFAAAYS